MTPKLSVVIPLHNEADVCRGVAAGLLYRLTTFNFDWEVVFVDAFSIDATIEQLKQLRGNQTRLVELPKRSGQSAALWAGLALARGEIIITMDEDGQNDPKDIAKLLETLDDCELVVGNRHIRQDSMQKRLFSRWANLVRNSLTGSQLPDSGCGLKAFRRDTLAMLLPINGMHRFIPIMVEISGGRVVSVDVNHRPRIGGRSKYGILDRLLVPFVDCLTLAWLKRRRLPTAVLKSNAGTDVAKRTDEHRVETTTNILNDSVSSCYEAEFHNLADADTEQAKR